MRILFLSGHYPPHTAGGGEISTHYIAQGLLNRSIEVEVIAEGKTRTSYEIDGVSVTTLPLGLTDKPLFERAKSSEIARKLEEELSSRPPYDIIHAHDFRSALALACLNISAQKVVTIRDYASIAGDTNNISKDGKIPQNPFTLSSIVNSHRIWEVGFPRNLARFWQYFYNVKFRQQSFSQIPSHIYISHAQKKHIEPYLSTPAHSTVIYNPIQPDFLLSPSQPASHPLEVLYIGRIEMYKGVDLLLSVWPAVLKKYPAATLRLVGEGAQQSEYQQLVKKLGIESSITFSGRLPWDTLQQVYDKAAVLVAPHKWIEPFGRTVVEAMARKKLVIASNIGGPAEIVQDKKTGFLFQSGSEQDLINVLLQALSLSREDATQIGNKAFEWVKSHLSEDVITQHHENFYRQITAK